MTFTQHGVPHTCEHENGLWRELELVDQQVLHALRIIDATFKLVPRVPVRYPNYHRLLPPVRVRRGARRRVAVRRRSRRRRRRVGLRKSRRRRRSVAMVGDVGDSLAESAANRRGSGWELQRGLAIGAIH